MSEFDEILAREKLKAEERRRQAKIEAEQQRQRNLRLAAFNEMVGCTAKHDETTSLWLARWSPLIGKVASFWREDGLLEKLKNAPPDLNETELNRWELAKEILLCPDDDQRTKLLCQVAEVEESRDSVVLWLRYGFPDHIKVTQPAPTPPDHYEEGGYFEPVDTLEDLLRWLDQQILALEMTAPAGGQDGPSNGASVRNCYRLIDKLGLEHIPLAPLGPLTLRQEITVLGNVRRLLAAKDDKAGSESSTDRAVSPTAGVEKVEREKPRVGPLGLTWTANPRAARRGTKTVEFKNQNSSWQLFLLLVTRYPAYYKAVDLGHDAFNADFRAEDLAENSVHQHVGQLRKLLKSLDLDPRNCRGQGYRLEIIDNKSQPTKRRKPQ